MKNIILGLAFVLLCGCESTKDIELRREIVPAIQRRDRIISALILAMNGLYERQILLEERKNDKK